MRPNIVEELERIRLQEARREAARRTRRGDGSPWRPWWRRRGVRLS